MQVVILLRLQEAGSTDGGGGQLPNPHVGVYLGNLLIRPDSVARTHVIYHDAVPSTGAP
jgi:hypothetical protein